ncbi:MAG: hypothetical protein NVSMB31_13570 [Vulcanimicrobiaceae bacterium]
MRVVSMIVAFLAIAIATPADAATCSRFAKVKNWAQHMHLSYDRTAHTPYYIEHASGSADYTSTLTPSTIGVISFNGYSQTWVGKASGTAQLTDEVTHADGSPLSHPDILHGSGPLVPDPPLGRFGPEQFWINPDRCTYAFYTSAAIAATHTYESGSIAGTDAHIEELPIPADGRSFTGTKTLPLPNPTNYEGGDQFHFPCRLTDWCNRHAGPGSATLTWSFIPGSAPAPTPSPQKTLRCPRADTNSGSSNDATRDAIRKAFAQRGMVVPLRDIEVLTSGGLRKIHIRIGANHHVLPSIECINEGIGNGSVAPNSQTGATWMIVGALQVAANQTRVTLREIDVATGAVTKTGLGTVSGTDAAAQQQAAALALGQLGAL